MKTLLPFLINDENKHSKEIITKNQVNLFNNESIKTCRKK